MSRTVSSSSGQVYGIARVARVWRVSRATVYRQRQLPTEPRRRPGSPGPMSDASLAAEIQSVLGIGGFHGEGYSKVWARLHHAGIRSSRHRVLRVVLKPPAGATLEELATRPARPKPLGLT